MSKIVLSLDLGESVYDPYDFVEAAIFAENVGFTKAWYGDHFVPWIHSGNRSAFVWSIIPVALEKTTGLNIGPLVTTPIGARYHPAMIAQASATIDNMYAGRFRLGVGTGEAINETPFWNNSWPRWRERMDRLVEGIKLIRQLWSATNPFEYKGNYFSSNFYYLYTKPKGAIPIYVSATGKKASYAAGMYGDHLVTVSPKVGLEQLQNEILPAYEQGCKDARKTKGDMVVSLGFTFRNSQELLQSRNELGSHMREAIDLKSPMAVEQLGDKVTEGDIPRLTNLYRGWNDLIKNIEKLSAIGVNEIVLFSGADKNLISGYAKNVLGVF